MAIGSIFKKLFGGGGDSGASSASGEATEYQGYTIRPVPKKQGGQFLTAGVITKTFPDGVKEHNFVRADTHSSFDSACEHALFKGKQIVDEQGERMFRET